MAGSISTVCLCGGDDDAERMQHKKEAIDYKSCTHMPPPEPVQREYVLLLNVSLLFLFLKNIRDSFLYVTLHRELWYRYFYTTGIILF